MFDKWGHSQLSSSFRRQVWSELERLKTTYTHTIYNLAVKPTTNDPRSSVQTQTWERIAQKWSLDTWKALKTFKNKMNKIKLCYLSNKVLLITLFFRILFLKVLFNLVLLKTLEITSRNTEMTFKTFKNEYSKNQCVIFLFWGF